jgi:hypothetical protein
MLPRANSINHRSIITFTCPIKETPNPKIGDAIITVKTVTRVSPASAIAKDMADVRAYFYRMREEQFQAAVFPCLHDAECRESQGEAGQDNYEYQLVVFQSQKAFRGKDINAAAPEQVLQVLWELLPVLGKGRHLGYRRIQGSDEKAVDGDANGKIDQAAPLTANLIDEEVKVDDPPPPGRTRGICPRGWHD